MTRENSITKAQLAEIMIAERDIEEYAQQVDLKCDYSPIREDDENAI